MIKRFDVYLNDAVLGVVKAAEMALQEDQQRLQRVGLRYTAEFIDMAGAFALDPRQLPLLQGESLFPCQGSAPAILDDYLPDAWGRRVLAKLALQQGRRLNAHCTSDMLYMLQQAPSRIGALAITSQGEPPQYGEGLSLSRLQQAEESTRAIDEENGTDLHAGLINLVLLANSGSGVGGARPKALVKDGNRHYLAKFNRQADPFNNARVELACLHMAQAAGLIIGNGRIIAGVNGRDVLLLERFDVDGHARRHLISVNGLLKEANTQQDPGRSYRYDDVCQLLQRYSCQIEADLKQLLTLMLFNSAIHNTDDHERNISFMHTRAGYQLAPAYDLVPSLTLGEYHAAGYGYQPSPPTPSEAMRMGKIFGLPKGEVRCIAQQVAQAVSRWPEFAEGAEVTELDMAQVANRLR